MRGPRHRILPRPSLSFVLMSALFVVLWVAGGASRADVLGQSIVRAATWLVLVVAILFQRFPATAVIRPAALIVAAAILLTLLQLVPLPPELWQALPGRRALAEAAAASGQPQPWRPWSIVPGATLNATGSLVVPVAVLVLASGMDREERACLVWPILALMVGSTLIGLFQFSGVSLNSPFQNDTPGQISSTFANRNHFALFLAMGCTLIPAWTFPEGHRSGWRAPVAIGLLLLFVLMILATGSRAGLLAGALGLMLGLAMVRHRIRRELRHSPRWAFPAIIGLIVVLIATFVLISVAADRAASISRIVEMDTGQDMRSRGLPTVLAMIRDYFPAGTGLGTFDPMFRMHEPFDLLKATYFNHAHNDLLEIVLDAGLPGLLVLLGGLGWGLVASVRAWRAPSHDDQIPQLGATLLLLVLIASIVDYPARTPMIMAIVTLAAVWLNDSAAGSSRSALRSDSQHL